MSGDEPAGVVFPASADGRRSTSALGRAVVAEALAQVDPAGAHGAEHEANWRTGYLAHFRTLIEANPDYVPGYQMYAQTLAQNERAEDAKAILTQGIQAAIRQRNEHARSEMEGLLEQLS